MVLPPHRAAQRLGDGFYPGGSCVFHQVSKMEFFPGVAVGPALLVTDAFLGWGEMLKGDTLALKALLGSVNGQEAWQRKLGGWCAPHDMGCVCVFLLAGETWCRLWDVFQVQMGGGVLGTRDGSKK